MINVKWNWSTNQNQIKGFRYLWLKTVDGFNPVHHCAKCLKGSYSKKFSPKMSINQDIIESYNDGQVLYFCGVSSPYQWANNLHLAGIVTNGSHSKIKAYTGDVLIVKNCEMISIDKNMALDLFPSKGKEFLTCRNFQLGAQLFSDKLI